MAQCLKITEIVAFNIATFRMIFKHCVLALFSMSKEIFFKGNVAHFMTGLIA